MHKSLVKYEKLIKCPIFCRCFSQNTMLEQLNPSRNQNLRVMATPTWPVPYYKRQFRHPPAMENTSIDFRCTYVDMNDKFVHMGKQLLHKQGLGHVLNIVENHLPLTDYKTKFEDSTQFCIQYIDDLLTSISLPHKQNIQILKKYDLASCL